MSVDWSSVLFGTDATAPRTAPRPPQAGVVRLIEAEAQRQGVSPALALAIARQESGLNPQARSPKGAIGLMQLMPGTARDLGVNPYDVQDNIRGGLRYLKQQQRRFGDTAKALAAYNAGPGAVEKYGGVPPYKETQGYVTRIMGRVAQPPDVVAAKRDWGRVLGLDRVPEPGARSVPGSAGAAGGSAAPEAVDWARLLGFA